MNFKMAAAVLSLSLAGMLSAGEWSTDLPKAVAKAKAEGKLVLVDFTGSDWCGWCKKLKAEVFDTQAFNDYAAKNLVLVEVDFPHKTELPEAQKAANKALAQKYGVKGFPTLVILDGSGQQVGELGYMPGGPAPMITELSKLSKLKK